MSLTLLRPSLLTVLFGAVLHVHAATPTEQAEALIDRGEFLAAERLIESLALAKKPDPVAVWELSRVRTAQHQTDEAIKLAEKAIKLDPTQARFHAQLGAAIAEHLVEVGRLDRSGYLNRMRKSYEKALSLDPDNVAALVGLARQLWWPPGAAPADIERAHQLASRARTRDPFRGEFELGAIAMRRNDYQTAIGHYETAAQLNPKNVDAQLACGIAYFRLGRRAEARARLEIALRLAPSSEPVRDALQALDRVDAGEVKPKG